MVEKSLTNVTATEEVIAKRANLTVEEVQKELEILKQNGKAKVLTTAAGKKFWKLA